MPPNVELQRLTCTVIDAVCLAAEGRLAGGYTVLLAGLERAQELEESGLRGAPDLVLAWRKALERYCERHGVKPG